MAPLNDRAAIARAAGRGRAAAAARIGGERAVDHDDGILDGLAGLGLEQRVGRLAAAQRRGRRRRRRPPWRWSSRCRRRGRRSPGRSRCEACQRAAAGFPLADGGRRRMAQRRAVAFNRSRAGSLEGRPHVRSRWRPTSRRRSAEPDALSRRARRPGRDPRRGARPARRGPPRLQRVRVLRGRRAHHRAGQSRRRGRQARWHAVEHRDRRGARRDDGAGGGRGPGGARQRGHAQRVQRRTQALRRSPAAP